MLDDAAAKAERLVAHLDRDLAAMQPAPASAASTSIGSMMDGERVIKTAADAARRLVRTLRESAQNQAKS